METLDACHFLYLSIAILQFSCYTQEKPQEGFYDTGFYSRQTDP